VLATVLVLALGPTSAFAGPADVSATRTYVQANYALVRYAAVRLGTAEALLQGVLNKVRANCPLAASGSPQNPESTLMSYDVIGAMVLAAYHAAMPEINAFIRVASRLRWSDGSLTRSVHAYAANLKTLSSLRAPDLCADARAWAASGYTKLPATTQRFDQRFIPAWVAIGLIPPQLGRFQSPDVRALLRRNAQVEMKLENFEANAVQTYAEVMNALAVLP
jgi:hypothetical protein